MTGELPIAGALVEIPESGYLYGMGKVIMRVTAVEAMADQAWVRLTGHQIGWDGRRIGLRAVVALRSAITLVRHPA